MNRFGKILLALLLVCPAVTQALTPPPPKLPPRRPPQIWLDPAQKLQPIELKDVAIDIAVRGFVATTRIDLTFYNPNARVLEGELVFPLSEGQSITGYALDVNGQLRQGVVVEKETARVAYEETIRRGIDPGLAELTQGNVFRTRLYPLPANGSKRVQLSFDQPLRDTGSAYRYALPLLFERNIANFKVHAEAVRSETAPTAQIGGGKLGFERVRDSFVADLERRDFHPEGALVFDLPKPATPVSVFSVPDALEPATQYFVAQVDSAAPAKAAALPSPRRITIYYDASGSAATRDRKRELDFLETWLATFSDAQIALVAFRNEADAPQTFALRGGKAAGLRQAIEALPLDGASAYGSLQGKALVDADLAIVIGDGMNNFGTGEPQWPGGNTRVVFLHAAQTVDTLRLTRWARRAGGDMVNLLELDPEAALRQLQTPRWSLRATRVLRGQCQDLVPRAPQPAGADFAFYGRCSKDAEIELDFGSGSGTAVTRQVKLAEATTLDPQRGEFVPRLWAVAQIAELELAPQRDRDTIVALSKQFGVVTRDTSMLVLDRIEDYVRYKVEPREPELANAYRELVARQPKPRQEQSLDARLAVLISRWTSFRNYHEQRHPWLETLLVPTAQREAALWKTQQPLSSDREHEKQAVALAAQAETLQKRWLQAGADASSRGAWEKEATALMLQLDGLRRLRLEKLPDSDEFTLPLSGARIAADRDGGGAPGRARVQSTTGLSTEVPTIVLHDAAPRSMPAPAPAAEAAAVGGAPREAKQALDADSYRADANAGPAVRSDAGIELREWDPNTPYLAALRAAADPYAAYLAERARNAATPAFFLDCANFFRNEAKDARLALRVLSNLAEIDFESAPLLRVLAYRLQQWDRFDLAVPLFEQVLTLRGEEPQSRRDLALALSRQPQPDSVRAVQLLWEVTTRDWSGRFPEVEIIALHELNDVIARTPAGDRSAVDAQIQKLGIPAGLLQHVPVELRVVMTWDSDNTDIDLWVIDPSGEKAVYNHPRTRTGGHLSRDFTGGYGPEVFTIRRALPGTYIVKTNYYSDRQQKLTGAVTLQLEFLTGFDSGQGKRQAVTRRLEDVKGEIEIGRFTVGAAAPVPAPAASAKP